MNRGSRGLPVIRSSCSTPFNEAPIHESGKSRLRRRPPIPLPGFNEAPIHESGKYDRRVPHAGCHDVLQ